LDANASKIGSQSPAFLSYDFFFLGRWKSGASAPRKATKYNPGFSPS
jgi:hypothetical protein